MATHSSILAWRVPWTEEPGGLQSLGSQRVDTTEATQDITQPPKKEEKNETICTHNLKCLMQSKTQKYTGYNPVYLNKYSHGKSYANYNWKN